MVTDSYLLCVWVFRSARTKKPHRYLLAIKKGVAGFSLLPRHSPSRLKNNTLSLGFTLRGCLLYFGLLGINHTKRVKNMPLVTPIEKAVPISKKNNLLEPFKDKIVKKHHFLATLSFVNAYVASIKTLLSHMLNPKTCLLEVKRNA